jgi:hypothetical protein
LSDQDVSHEINLYGLDGCNNFEKYNNGSIRYIHPYVRIVSNTVVKNSLWMNELYLGTSIYNMDKIIIYELDYDNTYRQLTENDRIDLSL